MTKRNSIALKVGSVVSFVVAGFAIFCGLCIIFNWLKLGDKFNEIVTQIISDPLSSWQGTYKYMVLIETLFASVINIYAGLLYLKISKQKSIMLGVNRILTYLAVMQLLFTSNVVSAVISIAVAININSRLNNNAWSKMQAGEQTLASKVTQLKYLLSSGKITQEEYDKQFNALLEESARNSQQGKM